MPRLSRGFSQTDREFIGDQAVGRCQIKNRLAAGMGVVTLDGMSDARPLWLAMTMGLMGSSVPKP
ncbi:MAG: hypothetical protein IOC54_11845 [Methylobacterium sp.]|jgi:hypothetical protein|nr:hypothetical protein [Methylobacterium sp.]MCA3652517.1 hypothetical protein [Methylobacterium sp.]